MSSRSPTRARDELHLQRRRRLAGRARERRHGRATHDLGPGHGAFESTTFANKTNATLNASALPNSAAINLDNTATATGLASLTVAGSAFDDVFRIVSTVVPTTITGGPGNDSFVLSATQPGSSPTLDGGEGSDAYLVAFGALDAPATISDTGAGGTDQLDSDPSPCASVTRSHPRRSPAAARS
jgi:hypothetical protein